MIAQVWTPVLAQTLALRSGADTSLIGATGRADRIIASAGKDLRLETLQDASTYDSKQQSIGVKAKPRVPRYMRSWRARALRARAPVARRVRSEPE
nr:hemagglutinin repeat-containing protein [Achromobacter insuavis]